MNTELKCPETATLVDFLLGKLDEPEQGFCEKHVADCDACEDTLRGLDANDTLGELTRSALASDLDSEEERSSSDSGGVVDQLLDNVRRISTDPANKQMDHLTLERAAEVARFLQPSAVASDIGRINHYRVTELLGAGSAGVVYRALDEKLEREVALKILRPSLGQVARTRFVLEAKTAAAVDHPNVITIYEVGETKELAYLAMQLLPGETLETRLQREVFLSEQQTRAIAANIADGLAAAHSKELIHRDIKPANIWLSDDEHVKILDFGLARIVNDDPGFTSTGMIAGTPSYMSPEQSKGAALDGRSDLFSLGCLIYRASTGRQPFGATNVLATLQAIQSDSPTPPAETTADVSQDLSDLTMLLLEKTPANRPEDAGKVANALRSDRSQWNLPVQSHGTSDTRFADSKFSPSQDQKLATSNSGLGRFGRWFGPLAALLALALLGAGGFLFGGDVIRIATGYGQLTIETDDPDVKVELLQQGEVVRIIDTKTDKRIDIKKGRYTLQVAGEDNGVQVTPSEMTISRGGKEIARVVQVGPKLDAVNQETKKDPGTGFQNTDGVVRVQRKQKLDRLQQQVDEIRESIPEDRWNTDVQLVESELALLEYQIELKMAENVFITPGDMVEAHSMMQRQLAMMKRARRNLLLVLNQEEDDSLEWTQFRKLRTQEKLARQRLAGFEQDHDLPRSAVVFNGFTLEHYLQIATTERSPEKLGDAYKGVAKLSDQFSDRRELLQFAEQAWQQNGDLCAANYLVRTNTRNYVPQAEELTKLSAGLNAVMLALEPAELRQLILTRIQSQEIPGVYLDSIFTRISNYQTLLGPLKAAFSRNIDELYQTVLDSRFSSTSKRKFLTQIHSIGLGVPDDAELREKTNSLLQNITTRDKASQSLLFALDPDAEKLFELFKDGYQNRRDESFPRDLFQRFQPGSKNAERAIGYLMDEALREGPFATVAFDMLGESMDVAEHAELIRKKLFGYRNKVINKGLQSAAIDDFFVCLKQSVSNDVWQKIKVDIGIEIAPFKLVGTTHSHEKETRIYKLEKPVLEVGNSIATWASDNDIQLHVDQESNRITVSGTTKQLDKLHQFLKETLDSHDNKE